MSGRVSGHGDTKDSLVQLSWAPQPAVKDSFTVLRDSVQQ